MTIPIKLPEINIPDVANDISLQQWLTGKGNAASFLKQHPDISSYIKKNRLKKTVATIAQATNVLRAQKRAELLPKGREISGIGSDAQRLLIYGECIVGGTITFIDSRVNNQYLDLIVSIAGHDIDSVQKLILDEYEVVFNSGSSGWAKTLRHRVTGELVTSPTDFIFMQPTLGADDQAAIGDLSALNSRWTSMHKQSGVAHAYIILVWNAEIFGDGMPDISFQVRGKKVYDPREDLNRYTATANLIIADYLTNTRYGMGVSWDRIDIASLTAAANIDDQTVTLQGGGTEYRYTINGYIEMGAQSHVSVLEQLCAACGGSTTYANGKWTFWPAAWRTPVVDLTEDDFRGPIKMQSMVSRDAIFNTVKGKFVDSSQRYIETDYPVVKNATYLDLDGEEIIQEIDFPFVSTAPTCQRLAKLELERNRQGIQIEMLASLKAYEVQVGENLTITFDRYAWEEKEFEVVKSNFVVIESGGSPELVVALSLRETAEGVFSWNYWEETTVDVAPNTNLPSPFSTPVITGLMAYSGTSELYRRGDGTIAPRVRLTWDAISDYFVTSGGFVEIQFKLSADATYLDSPRIPASSNTTYLIDVRDGAYYDIRVRGLNAFGTAGDWSYYHNYLVIGKTEPPEDVATLSYVVNEYGIDFSWPDVSDIDLSYYEVRLGSVWATGVSQAKSDSDKLRLSTRATGTYVYKIKAFDTSGNESVTEATATVIIAAPIIVSGSSNFNGGSIFLDWADAVNGAWATEDYTVSYGDVYASSTFIAKVKASQFSIIANWSGGRRFWVSPNDIYGNAGTPFSFDVNVVVPLAVSGLSAKTIDNNILLSWTASATGSLPIDYYQVKKGATFGAAVLIGTTSATYTTYFEIVSGDYIYWVTAVDTAGNISAESYIAVAVDQPADFILRANETFVLEDAETLTNVYVDDDGTLLLPVNTTETWEEHFGGPNAGDPNKNFVLVGGSQFILVDQDLGESFQDKIDDGYTIFAQPTPSTALYEQTQDIGTMITGGALVRIDLVTEIIAAGLTLTPTLSVSDDNSTWRDYAGVYSVFEADFQYVKISIAATGGGTALTRISSVALSVSVKIKRDSGSVEALASDPTGTEVTFGKTFLDIVGTPQVTTTEIIRAAEQWGTGNRLTAGDQTDFEPGNGDFTIAGWVKLQANVSPNYVTLAQKWSNASEREYLLATDPTNAGKFTFFVSSDGSAVSATVPCANLGTPPLNTWIFVACWHDATANVIGIRVNRLEPETAAFSAGIHAGTRTAEFALGGRSDSASQSLIGQMKNWGVWKGRVLSSSDLNSLYDCGFQKYSELSGAMTTSMVGFWALNEASGTREDAHSSNHDLTVSGTVGARILPLQGIVDFTDVPNPTTFEAYVFTESQIRVSASASWYADGFTNIG